MKHLVLYFNFRPGRIRFDPPITSHNGARLARAQGQRVTGVVLASSSDTQRHFHIISKNAHSVPRCLRQLCSGGVCGSPPFVSPDSPPPIETDGTGFADTTLAVLAQQEVNPCGGKPVLPVVAFVNSRPATVAFYGEAPGLVSGVMQMPQSRP